MESSLKESIYGCRIILNPGDSKEFTYAKRHEMWILWNNLKNSSLTKKDIITNILKSTYPLESYSSTNTKDKWGCLDDVEACSNDIEHNLQDIYSSLDIFCEVYFKPPLKWCRYMKEKGFEITLYFLNMDGREIYNEGNCGKCIYNQNKTLEEIYQIPRIENDKVINRIMEKYNDNNHITLRAFVNYLRSIYREKGFCDDFCDLLDIFEWGPREISFKIFKKKYINDVLEELEENVSNETINENEYLVKCDELKKMNENNNYMISQILKNSI